MLVLLILSEKMNKYIYDYIDIKRLRFALSTNKTIRIKKNSESTSTNQVELGYRELERQRVNDEIVF